VRGPVEFKFTLGSWDAVETDSAGGDIQNRGVVVAAGSNPVYVARVAGWRDPRTVRVKEHTARASVSILSEDFQMPELGRTRRVWVYLPPGYTTNAKRYPVLYMHDGQNLFDNATGFAGEWGIDETLDSLAAAGDKGVIVVAVDHGGTKRFDEYSPWKNAKYGGGEGDKYVEFLVKNLKPYVDSHYRTLPDRLNTGIAGSSMGGLISLYAVVKYPDVFSRAGIFSPALWVAPEVYSFVRDAAPLRPDVRLYFVSGALEAATGEESGVYVNDQKRMIETLVAAGLKPGANVVALIQPDGKHSEWFWRREFPAAYKWMFGR
jgi:metallo-beta-lactamase class B